MAKDATMRAMKVLLLNTAIVHGRGVHVCYKRGKAEFVYKLLEQGYDTDGSSQLLARCET
jgi:hypothetical protein